jgi:hypothetical protein
MFIRFSSCHVTTMGGYEYGERFDHPFNGYSFHSDCECRAVVFSGEKEGLEAVQLYAPAARYLCDSGHFLQYGIDGVDWLCRGELRGIFRCVFV